ncbi:MAG: HDOD domain-containing protein [Pseudomonadota bacterium]
MNEALASWVKRLDNHSLPALEVNIERLRQLGAQEDGDLDQMVAVIEADPGLTLRLMRYINNLRHKHLRSEISTVRHGLMMLGLSHVQQLPEGVAPLESLEPTRRPPLLRQLNRSFHAAWQARDWAYRQRDTVADELYMATLLHNVGQMLLTVHAPEELERVQELMHEKQMAADEAEYVVFGFSIDQLTLELARLWRLPSLLRDSLHSENAQHSRVLNVMLAAQLATEAEHGWYHRAMLELLEQLCDFLLVDIASTATLVHQNAVEAARASGHFAVADAACALLHPVPLEREERQADAEREQEQELSEFCLAPQRQVLLRVLKELAELPDGAPLRRALELALEGLHEGLGLNRVVFAMLTPDKEQLKARSIVGSENDPLFSRFAVDLASHNLFMRLMEKPQSLWLNDDNRGKFFPLIPIQFHKQIRIDSFFVMSLFVRSKPIGMFYADRHTEACKLDAESYRHFKHLVAQVSHTLSRIVNS